MFCSGGTATTRATSPRSPALMYKRSPRNPDHARNLRPRSSPPRTWSRRRGREDEGRLGAARLDAEQEASQGYKSNKAGLARRRWAGFKSRKRPTTRAAAIPASLSRSSGDRPQLPRAQGFHVHARSSASSPPAPRRSRPAKGIDWRPARRSPFCTLLREGNPVRLSDRIRNAGPSRSAIRCWIDQETEDRYTPYNHVHDGQARYEVINSMLSEEAVLGSSTHSLAEPNALTLWEAQFGDFANGAQVVFDQFISSGERKWLPCPASVCCCTPGYEGQGPEHSSARLDASADVRRGHMQVATAPTPRISFTSCAGSSSADQEATDPDDAEEPAAPQAGVSRLDEWGPTPRFHRCCGTTAKSWPARRSSSWTDDRSGAFCALSPARSIRSLRGAREARPSTSLSARVEQLYRSRPRRW